MRYACVIILISAILCPVMRGNDTEEINASITYSMPLIELSRSHMPWEWQSGHFYQIQRKNSQIVTEDTLSVYFVDPEKPDFFDVWVWRAERSGHTAIAEDMHGYSDKTGRITIQSDTGRLPWRVYRPFTYEGGIIPRYKYDTTGQGSVCDVKAFYSYDDGILTVQFTRAYCTGNKDDIQIVPGRTLFAVTTLPPGKATAQDLKFSIYYHGTTVK